MPRSKETPLSPTQYRLVGLILAMVVVIPFVATPMDRRLHGIAALMFEGLSIVALTLLVSGSRWRLDKDSVVTFFTTGINLPALLFLGLCGVSTALSPIKAYSLQEFLRVLAGCLVYFAVSYQFRHSNLLNRLVYTLIGVGAFAAFYGFWQYAHGGSDMAAGMFADHQTLGAFLMLILPFAAFTALTEKQRNRQLAALFAVVLVAAGLLVTQCRSAWVGSAVALATMSGLSWQIVKRERTRARKQDLIPSIGLCVAAVALFMLLSPQGDTISTHAATLQNVQGEHSFQAREQIWQGVVKMVVARPLTGFGLGLLPFYQYRYTHWGYPLSAAASAVPDLTVSAHNIYLQVAAELGIPGLILWLAIPITFCTVGIRRLLTMHAGVRRNLLMASVASTVAFSVDAFANPSWQLGQVSMFLWLVMGVGVSSMIPVTRREERFVEPITPQWYRRPVAAGIMLAAVLPLMTSVVASAGNDGDGTPAVILGGGALLSQIVPALFSKLPLLVAGDNMTILVAGHPEFGWTGLIDTDGTINYPPLGKVQAAGIARADLARKIEDDLASQDKIGETDTVTVDNVAPRPLVASDPQSEQPGQKP
jgi:putative inorganic carbon (HCO3(-)) transporter